MTNALHELFGDIDIYLFDQLLKGRFDKCNRVIDIGCGGGRNLHYFLKNGFEVYGIDRSEQAIDTVKALCKQLAPQHPTANFMVADIENLPFEKESFDLAICSAVLHFADNKTHFENLLRACWGTVKPGGYLFTRLASDIGIEDLVIDLDNGKHMLPDGSERYLVNHQRLLDYTHSLGGELFEPIKTTNVHNLRAMTTWCLQKKVYQLK